MPVATAATPTLAGRLAEQAARVDQLRAGVGQVGAGLGAGLQQVLEQLVVDHVGSSGHLAQHGGRALDHPARLGVDQEELLLDPERAHRHAPLPPRSSVWVLSTLGVRSVGGPHS